MHPQMQTCTHSRTQIDNYYNNLCVIIIYLIYWVNQKTVNTLRLLMMINYDDTKTISIENIVNIESYIVMWKA